MGGMSSKIEAAKIATNSGVPMIMANGNLKNVIKRILKAEDIGTFFLPNSRLVSKKRWIAYSSKVSGKIIVDLGARRALVNNAKSLLPSGISDCSGSFAIGDIVSIIDINGNDFARGLTNYSSKDIKKIKGLKSNLIKQTLGYKYFDEIVHRDNLVII